MMNIKYEYHIIFMGAVHMQFKSYQITVSSVRVVIFFNFDFHQDSMLNMLLGVLCLAAPCRYKGNIRFVHQHLCSVKETKSGSIM